MVAISLLPENIWNLIVIIIVIAILGYWQGVVTINMKAHGFIPESVCDTNAPTPLTHECVGELDRCLSRHPL